MSDIEEETISKSLKKTNKNLVCEILNVSRKKINYPIDFLDYIKLKKLNPKPSDPVLGRK